MEEKWLYQEVRNYGKVLYNNCTSILKIIIKKKLQERKNPTSKSKYIVKAEDQPLKCYYDNYKTKNCKSNYNYNKQWKNRHEDVNYDIKNIRCWGGK